MTKVTIEIKKDYVHKILDDLQVLKAISIIKPSKVTKTEAKFSSIRLSTKDFKFNREKANER